jgi:hypothetical protein
MPSGPLRTRRKDIAAGTQTVSVPQGSKYDPCGFWASVTDEESLQITRTLTQIVIDSPTSDFRKRIRRGEIVPTNYLNNVKTLYPDKLAFRRTDSWPSVGQCCNNTFHSGSLVREYLVAQSPPDLSLAHDLSELTSKIPQMLKDSIASAKDVEFDLLTTLAERKETFEFIANRIHKVVRPLRSYVEAVQAITRRGGTSRSLANLWLEYRYAIMPIIFDVQAGLKILSGKMHTQNTGHSVATDSYVGRIDVSGLGPSWDGVDFFGEFFHLEVESTAKLHVYSTGRARIDALAGIGINPFLTAWELIPLSFVLDWFIDVGDTIASYGMPWGVKIVDSGYTLKVDTYATPVGGMQERINASYESYCNGIPITVPQARYRSEIPLDNKALTYRSYQRRQLASSDAAWLPRFRLKLNWQRVLDAVALLRGIRAINRIIPR